MCSFRIAAASISGKAHRRAFRNGQDALAVVEGDDGDAGKLAIFAVADGCSAGARSEVGAGLGARFVVEAARRRTREHASLVELSQLPHVVIADVVEELRRVARALGGTARVVDEMLLFTLHVAVVTEEHALLFGVGDGVFAVDGVVHVVNQGDAPDYPAYALFPEMQQPRVNVHHRGPWSSSIALGTDGVVELINASEYVMPDGSKLGGLEAFMGDDVSARAERYFTNPSLARKRLIAWTESAPGAGPSDDCTFVVAKRCSRIGSAR